LDETINRNNVQLKKTIIEVNNEMQSLTSKLKMEIDEIKYN